MSNSPTENVAALDPGVLLLSDIKLATKPVLENASASLWNVGDGVLCFEFHTKMNTIDKDTLHLLNQTITTIENSKGKGKYKALVLYNEGKLFSAGLNLNIVLQAIHGVRFTVLEDIIHEGQETYRALRFAKFPTVAAPQGLALGGGCEITLHCAATQALTETNIGLVEFNIGFVPGWGGCTQMLVRAFAAMNSKDPFARVLQVFETIFQARRSMSAAEARDLLFLRETDSITMNRDRLLFDAKQRALQLAKDYKPPGEAKLNLPGNSGQAALAKIVEEWRASGKASPHDVTVLKSLATVLCGEESDPAALVSEEQVLALECREFIKLGRMPETLERIEYILRTGKPLRN